MKYKKCNFKQKELLNLFKIYQIYENAKFGKVIINTKKDQNENEDEDKNKLLEYIKDVDNKLFKKYSHSKDFNSFINEFEHATNKKDKEKIVNELKEIDIVYHYIEMDENSV